MGVSIQFLMVFITIIVVSLAGPISIIDVNSKDILSSPDNGEDGGTSLAIDDFTTHGLERLSSAATCLVAGVEYTHGQQIYRSDRCEFCLCLDGEMFCWWQDCPPAIEGPCKDRGPFSPCQNSPFTDINNEEVRLPTTPFLTKSSSIQNTIATKASDVSENEMNIDIENSTVTFDSNSTDGLIEENVDSSSIQIEMNAEEPACIVMGRKYKIGDKLSHDTGNCVECVCGNGAKVTCSPHQCAPGGGGDLDINDYRQPGPRQNDLF